MAAQLPAAKPQVVVLPYPLQGHVTPLLQLSNLLADRGLPVTFVTTEPIARELQRAAERDPRGDGLARRGIRLLPIPDGRPGDRPFLEAISDAVAFIASLEVLHASFDECVRRLVQEQRLPIACIISDSFLVWSQAVADKWRIPRVSFWPQSLTTFACSLGFPAILAHHPNLDPFKAEVYAAEDSPTLTCIPGVRSIDARSLPFATLGGEHSASWLRDNLQQQLDCLNQTLCIICNTCPCFEEEVFSQLDDLQLSRPIFCVGPLFLSSCSGDAAAVDEGAKSSSPEEDAGCIQWLDRQQPSSVLYIAFGSVVNLEEQDAIEIARSLVACQVPFLWAIRNLTPRLHQAIASPNCMVVRWAPQVRVLSHEAIGGFFTHCGWNSTMESMSMGVPVIGWPRMLDQTTHCWLQVEKLKMGFKLELGSSSKIDKDKLASTIQSLMQDKEGDHMRARASQFARSAKDAISTTLASNLDLLVNAIISS